MRSWIRRSKYDKTAQNSLESGSKGAKKDGNEAIPEVFLGLPPKMYIDQLTVKLLIPQDNVWPRRKFCTKNGAISRIFWLFTARRQAQALAIQAGKPACETLCRIGFILAKREN